MIRGISILILISNCCMVAVAAHDWDPANVLAEAKGSVEKQAKLEGMLIDMLSKLNCGLTDEEFKSDKFEEILETKRKIGGERRKIIQVLTNFKTATSAATLVKLINDPCDPMGGGGGHSELGFTDNPTPAMVALEKMGEVAVLPLVKSLEERSADGRSDIDIIQVLNGVRCKELAAATLAWRYDIATSEKTRAALKYAYDVVSEHLAEKRDLRHSDSKDEKK